MNSSYTTIIPSIFLAVFLTAFTACHSDRRLNVMEQAGTNRAELEKVLHHYRNDELKLRAVEFLLANMDVHYTPESPGIHRFRQGVDSLYRHHASLQAIPSLPFAEGLEADA